MDKQEKIVCGAVKTWMGNKKETKLYVEYPLHYKIGRHEVNSNIGYETGFITSKNHFVDAKEAMRIAIKGGQYPDYELRKKVCLHAIEEANENKKHNQGNIGFDGQLYVADIEYLENKIKEYDSLLERDYLKPEDLY